MTPEIEQRIAEGRRCMLKEEDADGGERCPERAEVSFRLNPGEGFLDLCIPHARLIPWMQHPCFADYIMRRELELAVS
jgi:hypothetical protein